MSSLIEDITKLQPLHIQSAFAIVLSVVAPGYLMVLHFWPKLFFDLDNVKLFFLAISFSLPVLAMNTAAVIGSKPFDKQINMGGIYLSAMMISFLMLYGCLLIAWFLKLSFGQFVLIIIALELSAIMVSYRVHLRTIKTARKALQQVAAPPEK